MRFPAILLLVAAALTGVYYLTQRDEIRVLFESSRAQGDPLAFLNDLPEIKPAAAVERRAVEKEPSAPPPDFRPEAISEPAEPEPMRQADNRVPNRQLQRLLLQILAARKLADGVSLSVTDDTVEVFGEVASAERRRRILEIIDGGREARRLDDRNLNVNSR